MSKKMAFADPSRRRGACIDRKLDVRRFCHGGALDIEELSEFLTKEGLLDLHLFGDTHEGKAWVAFATDPKTMQRITFFLER